MALTIDANQPDRPISGDTLMRRSVAGRKQQFTNQSSTGFVSFSVPAGTVFSVTANFTGWPENLADSAQNANNLTQWSNVVVWPYEDIFIDSDSSNNRIGGTGLTSAQRKVVMYRNEPITQVTYSGSVGYTSTTHYILTNNDSSDHTVYFRIRCKYILFGEGSL